MQPFTLWWIGQRMTVLNEAGGLERSAMAWGCGVTVLVLGATGIQLIAPVFIEVALPAGYHAAATLLPAAILVCVLNELCTLSNVGSHMRATGFPVMAINMAGAVGAVVGYALLVPHLGAVGALVGMMIGHSVRLGLFVLDGRSLAPIAYPACRTLCLAMVAVALVALAPEPHAIAIRLAWTAVTLLSIALLAVVLRLLPIAEPAARLMTRFRQAGPARV